MTPTPQPVRIVWSSGPLTTALLRRLGLDPDFTDEQIVVIGRIQ